MPQAAATDITPKRIYRQVVEAQIDLLIDMLNTLDGDTDAEPSLGWLTGNQTPEHHSQASADFIGNGNAGDEREDEDEREPPVDGEASLGWTSTFNQTAPAWQANHLGATDLEDGVGPVRKKRPASRTGNRVLVGLPHLATGYAA
ncbi:hypothetical protein ABIA99_004286 [Bradyrhizobium sp. LB12.1]|uniref:hypothetical protein n=1 Tax=Bradyrhizobium sp. LB12.1 TaxID=3156327 RepID=UPI00339843DF